MPVLPGQVTCLASRATGAAQSEPHRPPAVTSGRAMTVQCGTGWRRVPGCTRGARWVPGWYQGARSTQVWTSAYAGYPWARLGQGRCQNGARTVPELVPELVPNSAITAPCTRHPSIRYPTPSTRHPSPRTCNVPRVLCYSVLAFRATPPAISDLSLNLLTGP